jgi:hypothetical protein
MTNSQPTRFSWNFAENSFGWQGGFADYPIGEEAFYELAFGLQPLPQPLDGKLALSITGHNHSDDLFMYFRQSIAGLLPDTTYEVNFAIELASNAPDGSFGIGGSPANSVYLKAGATQIEPVAIGDRFALLNVDKGNQANAGQDAVVLGDIAKPDDGTFDYALITRSSRQPLIFQSGPQGQAWLYFGTDSGFEGVTHLYYTQFQAEFTPATPPSAAVPEPSMLIPLLGVAAALLLRSTIAKLPRR